MQMYNVLKTCNSTFLYRQFFNDKYLLSFKAM